MAVNDRMVLLIRALAVFALNAALGLAASAVSVLAGSGPAGSGAVATLTFGWLIPMTATCALALAAATLAGSPIVGVTVGLGGWAITVLSAAGSTGDFTAVLTDSAFALPYLAFAACCAAVVLYATRIPRGTA
jgi:hypothetical protein